MDKIKIKDLELYCRHGVFPEEKVLGQKFLFSAVLYLSTRAAGRTDELEKSVNYGEICHFIHGYMEEHTYKLLEAALEHLAEAILLKWTQIESLTLEVKKPWAPVGLPLDTVAVEITRGWHTAYIALGSNMGDKGEYLQCAVEALKEREDCRVTEVSDFINTAPYGVTDQDEFLNGVLMMKTLLTPEELLERLHEIEAGAGRVRLRRWGPRTLDLDILLYDDLVIDTEELHIPHIDMQNRDFVLEPLAQIAPWVRHPVFNKTIKQLEGELHDRLKGTEG